jgi:ribosome biogenesis GTPase / thiamine phosphate phosphatase
MSQQELFRGRISFSAQEQYRVLLEDVSSQKHVENPALPSGNLRAFGELPAVGDWVWVRPTAEFCLIEEVEPRRTAFVRKAAGRAQGSQCVAANIDVCFVVSGLDGDLNLRRIERYLVLAWESGAVPVVVLNKADLRPDAEAALATVQSVAGAAQVVAISARRSVDALVPWLHPGATAALLGSSGAGKSTIANALTSGSLATREVRPHDSRGRHTTTARMLLPLPGGAWLIDTPGMRELGLLATDAALDLAFEEIAALAAQCHFRDCRHDEEPGCRVRQALEEGAISPVRWLSYAKLQREARHHAVETDARARLAEKQKWKSIHKAQKRLYRERDR